MAKNQLNKVIDSGTGYVKFSDGLMIQNGSTNWITVAANGYTDSAITFPIPFISSPNTLLSLVSDSSSPEIGRITVALNAESATGITARIFNNGSSSRSPAFRWFAIGRWK